MGYRDSDGEYVDSISGVDASFFTQTDPIVLVGYHNGKIELLVRKQQFKIVAGKLGEKIYDAFYLDDAKIKDRVVSRVRFGESIRFFANELGLDWELFETKSDAKNHYGIK